MGIFDQDLILPGTITEIVSEYSFDYDTSKFGTTDSVTIIGTAFNGPVGRPTAIYSPEHAKYTFGESYDYQSKKEATLVASIQDAWDRGCRTIYAVRVSGKDMFKDFQFAIDTSLRLRVSGIFPSNANKDVYMAIEASDESYAIRTYKPAVRATIEEKVLGVVENENDILINTIDLSGDLGYTKDSRLVDVINTYNNSVQNNVLRLSIVDANGNDVTMVSQEAQGLALGVLFGGVYFIGRDTNKSATATDVKYVVTAPENTPFTAFAGKVFKSLTSNTDVNTEFPISSVEVTNALPVPGKINAIFGKDKVDYEEVDINGFELYKRLGLGYATTAKIEVVNETSKVKETPSSDENKVIGIENGIFGTLENLKSDYRVLTIGNANDVISGKIPRKVDFAISISKVITVATAPINSVVKPIIVAKAKLAKTDLGAAKKYKFTVKELDNPDFADSDIVVAGLFTEKVFDFEDLGTIISTDIDAKEYILVNIAGIVYVYNVTFDEDDAVIIPVGPVDQVLSPSDDPTFVVTETSANSMVTISSAAFDFTTLSEFVDILNADECANQFFTYEIGPDASSVANGYMSELVTVDFVSATASDDRELSYDVNLYIPYKTTDNFARLLAQHCTYTALKTAQTHGIIGCKPLLDVSLNSVNTKVNELSKEDYNLYAKKTNGKNMLDRNNNPYPIGRSVSVVVNQYNINTGNGYNFVSNGAAGYAGMVSGLSLDRSSTNQPINIPTPSYVLSNSQLAKLTQAGYVTVKESYTKGVVVTDGVTMAPIDSPFRRLSSTRIANAVDEIIRTATEPFIGLSNNMMNQSSMQTAIKSGLEKIKDVLIEKYSFNLVIDPASTKLGIINIEYSIIPIYEIRQIRNKVTVKDN